MLEGATLDLSNLVVGLGLSTSSRENQMGVRLPRAARGSVVSSARTRFLASPPWLDHVVEFLVDAMELELHCRRRCRTTAAARRGGEKKHATLQPVRQGADSAHACEHPPHPAVPRRISRRPRSCARRSPSRAIVGGGQPDGHTAVAPHQRRSGRSADKRVHAWTRLAGAGLRCT